MDYFDLIIVGGGAAGFFAAINCAEMNSGLKIQILERGKEGLQKVRISGGGRCNVTHAEFDPKTLVDHYPRGRKELIGPFHQFMTGDTMEWFTKRGVALKIENDGRIFPESDASLTIVNCFLKEAERLKIEIAYNQSVKGIQKIETGWNIITQNKEFMTKTLMVATGSNQKMWDIVRGLGHKIIAPVPSLFAFDIVDQRIKDIPGIAVPDVKISVIGTKLQAEGALLITHRGMSGPVILKLSAFGALELARLNYQFQIEINWINKSYADTLEHLKGIKSLTGHRLVLKERPVDLPKRLWQKLVTAEGIGADERWAELKSTQIECLARQLTSACFEVNGKSTHKEEFVTAGGVELKEVDFRTFESKLHKNLYFAGEILNIDAVTGGFNFQNAWTGAYLAAVSISG